MKTLREFLEQLNGRGITVLSWEQIERELALVGTSLDEIIIPESEVR